MREGADGVSLGRGHGGSDSALRWAQHGSLRTGGPPLRSLQRTVTLPMAAQSLNAVAFNSDNSVLASGELAAPRSASGAPCTLSYVPCPSAGSYDKSVRLWDCRQVFMLAARLGARDVPVADWVRCGAAARQLATPSKCSKSLGTL